MPKEVYTIDGKKYEVEVKESSNGKQKIVINGQEITLKSAHVLDNTGRDGLNVELQITASGKNVKLGETRLDFEYNGPYKEEINAVMRERVARGSATQMERIAVYQQDYNNRAAAEALARGESENDADLLKLTEAQISGREPLPDIKKRFPWAYATISERAKDTITKAWNKDAEYRVNCRRYLEEKQEIWFDRMFRDGNRVIIRDRFAENNDTPENDLHNDLALQEKASQAKSKLNNTKEDEGTERLVAAATQKEAAKKNKNKQTPQIQNTSDGYDRA